MARQGTSLLFVVYGPLSPHGLLLPFVFDAYMLGSDVSRQNIDLPRIILLNRDKKFPLLWQVLGNNYSKKIAFGHHSDPEGKFAASLGFTAREEGKFSKVVVYPAGSSVPILYEGKTLRRLF